MDEFREKLRSLNFGGTSREETKVTIDQHDHGTVEVTEHRDGRVDVTVKPDALQIQVDVKEPV